MGKKEKFAVIDHMLVPKHEIVPHSEVSSILESLKVLSAESLPRILSTDPVAKSLDAKRGDLVRIYRNEPTGEIVYYRTVV